MSIGSQPSNGNPSAAAQAAATKLAIKVDGQKHNVNIADLSDETTTGNLAAQIAAAEHPAIVSLEKLLNYTDPDRWAALDFVAELSNVTFRARGVTYNSLIDAVVSLFDKHNDPELERRAKLAALEVAVLQFHDALDVACRRLLDRMRAVGITGVRQADLVSDAKQVAKQISQGGGQSAAPEAQPINEAVADAQVPDAVIIPGGWQMSDDGIYRANGESTSEVASAPLIITERAHDVQRGTEVVTLAWRREGGWRSRTVERRVIADSRRIIELADYGAPINSGNGKEIVEYLAAYEAANIEHLPNVKVSSSMGWQGVDGVDGFLWGRHLISAQGMLDPGAAPIRFRGADVGDEQLVDAFRSAGTYEGWRDAIQAVAIHVRVIFALYTAFVPTMLPIFKAENFVLDYAGPTSQGKTTTLKIAASVWGCPDIDSGITFSWNTTQTWRERVPSMLGHVPFVLDDTKTVRNVDEIAKTIYSLTQGRGRGRGAIHGLAQQDHCQTVLLSSGEQPAVSFTQDGGTRARALTIWGSPFGDTSEATAAIITQLAADLQSNYWHAGPQFVIWLQQRRDRWPEYRAKFLERVGHYRQLAGNNGVACRMASMFAAVWVTSKVVHQALSLPWEWNDPVAPLLSELTREAGEADRAEAALRHVMSWANSHADQFYDPMGKDHQGRKYVPQGGWAGRWERTPPPGPPESQKPWALIGIMPHILEQLLADVQFDADAIIRTWRDRGWLKTDKEAKKNRSQYSVRINGVLARVYAIRRTAIDQAEAM